MTKRVRIENADTADYKVVVEVWDKGHLNEEGIQQPDTLAASHRLDHPTAMTNDSVYLTSTRYLVVREVQPGEDA